MSVYVRENGRYVATSHSAGPWDPEHQHGGAPAALLAAEMQSLAPDMRVARLTYEILGPVPVGPVVVTSQIVKPGERFQLAEADLGSDEGRTLMRARAVLLRREAVTDPDGEAPAQGSPEDLGPREGNDAIAGAGFHLTTMELRDAGGTWSGAGEARTWFRMQRELIAGEGRAEGVPLAAAVADFGNGTSHRLPFREFLFVNTDLTLHLHRDPVGEWLLLQAQTVVGPEGSALASSVLFDIRGAVGLAAQTLYVARR